VRTLKSGDSATRYPTLSLPELGSALRDMARDAETAFGFLSARQLNWRPGENRWSAAQCFQHLLTGNRLIIAAAQHAMTHPANSLLQRVPLVPGLMGRALILSQAPGVRRKYTAPEKARPSSSDISGDVIGLFVAQHHDAADWVETIDARAAARTIMISPFIRFVAYSVLDGCRLVVAHDHRHYDQALRVVAAPGFPSS
jgi:hypothetical protein